MQRKALNRGTAVYLGGSRVRLVWPCGCTRVETLKTRVGGRELGAPMTQKMVRYWRTTGVTLKQCKKHPDWYSPQSQVERLNQLHPQQEPPCAHSAS